MPVEPPVSAHQAPWTAIRKQRGHAAVAGVLLAVLFACTGHVLGAGLVDDAYIFLRYGRHVAEGVGVVFNPGERVEGYTSPLWLLWTTALFLVNDEPSSLLSLSSGLCGVGAAWLLYAGSGGGRRSLLLSAALVTSPAFVFWSYSGLETSLLSLLLMGTFLLLVLARPTGRSRLAAGTLFSLACLTRPEVLALAPLAVGWIALAERRRPSLVPSILLFLAPLALIAAHLLWRHAYYGSWLPNTYFAKADLPFDVRLRTGSRYVGRAATAFAPMLLAAGILCAFRRDRRAIAALAVTACWASIVAGLGGDHFVLFRFLVPVLPLVLLAMALAPAPHDHSRWHLTTLAALAASPWLLFHPEALKSRQEVQLAAMWAETGRWLGANVPANTRIAAPVVGAIPYFSQLPTIDLLGLTDFEIGRFGLIYPGGAPGHQRYLSSSVVSRRPALIILPSSGRVRTPSFSEWPSVPPNDLAYAYAVHDLLNRADIRRSYRAESIRMRDGSFVELLRLRDTH
jgi:hypothetical protein